MSKHKYLSTSIILILVLGLSAVLVNPAVAKKPTPTDKPAKSDGHGNSGNSGHSGNSGNQNPTGGTPTPIPAAYIIPVTTNEPGTYESSSSTPLTPSTSHLVVNYPGNLVENKSFQINGKLNDWGGSGLGYQDIIFYLDGNYFHHVLTNGDGTFQLIVGELLQTGSHHIDVYYDGAADYDPAWVSVPVAIQPNVKITLEGSRQLSLDEPIVLAGTMTDLTNGLGMEDQIVKFMINGEFLGQAHTDENGAFYIHTRQSLPAGNYDVVALFKGAHNLSPAFTVVPLKVVPAVVRIQTTPPIGGITLQMNDRLFTTDENGVATIQIAKQGTYRLNTLFDQFQNPSLQVQFGRWLEEVYDPFKDITVPTDKVVEIGVNVFHKVSFKFIDLDGLAVDPSRITSLSIRSTQGDVFNLTPGQSIWLPASRTARYFTNLEKTDLLYSVNNVTIDGSNVVNAAQQRFFAQPDDVWTISLLLYSLNINAKDGLFAAPTGKSVNIIFPDGTVKNYLLDKSGAVQIHGLARGIYHIALVGSSGLGTSMPVALSRNQNVTLNIVTKQDFVVVALFLSGLAIGLIIYGRPWLVHLLIKRKHYTARKMRWDSMHEN